MNLIFLTYINRSGSTFLAQQLSKFTDILICPEAEILIYTFLLNPNKHFSHQKAINKLKNIALDKKFKLWGLDQYSFSTLKKKQQTLMLLQKS